MPERVRTLLCLIGHGGAQELIDHNWHAHWSRLGLPILGAAPKDDPFTLPSGPVIRTDHPSDHHGRSTLERMLTIWRLLLSGPFDRFLLLEPDTINCTAELPAYDGGLHCLWSHECCVLPWLIDRPGLTTLAALAPAHLDGHEPDGRLTYTVWDQWVYMLCRRAGVPIRNLWHHYIQVPEWREPHIHWCRENLTRGLQWIHGIKTVAVDRAVFGRE